MKKAFIRSKDTANNLMDDGQVSPSEYAEDQTRYAVEDDGESPGQKVLGLVPAKLPHTLGGGETVVGQLHDEGDGVALEGSGARSIYDTDSHLHRAIDTLVDGTVPTDDAQRELYHALLDGASWHKADNYFVLMDYASYMDAKLRVNRDYADRLAFGRKCLENVASGSKFSSDRTIRQYADEIWHIKPVKF